MAFVIRKAEERDLPTIANWFVDSAWPLPPVDNLFPKDGLVAEGPQGLMACGWLYLTGTARAEISWLNVNPELPQHEQAEALSAIVRAFQGITGRLEPRVTLITSFTKDEALAAKLASLGFYKSPKFIRLTWINDESHGRPA